MARPATSAAQDVGAASGALTHAAKAIPVTISAARSKRFSDAGRVLPGRFFVTSG